MEMTFYEKWTLYWARCCLRSIQGYWGPLLGGGGAPPGSLIVLLFWFLGRVGRRIAPLVYGKEDLACYSLRAVAFGGDDISSKIYSAVALFWFLLDGLIILHFCFFLSWSVEWELLFVFYEMGTSDCIAFKTVSGSGCSAYVVF